MKNYKFGKIIFLYSCFAVLFFCFSSKAYAKETLQEDFAELYYCEDLSDGEIKVGNPMAVQRMSPIGDHIYLAEPNITKAKEETTYNGYTTYSMLRSAESNGTGFSGKLISETARITTVYEWKNKENNITSQEINYDKAFVLPDGIDKSKYSYRGDKGELYQAISETKGNVFNTLGTGKRIGSHFESSPDVFTMIVEDKGIKTEYTLIVGHEGIDYQSFYDMGKGDCKDSEYLNVNTDIQLYNGTSGKKELLDKEYQYGENLGWQRAKQIFGWENGSLISNEKMKIPISVKSIRLSYQENMPEAKQAFFDGIPGTTVYSRLDEEAEAVHNYYFYRSKSRMICINGRETFDIYNGQESPELPLKKGINVIFLAGTDTETAKQNNRHFRMSEDYSYVLFVYWDGEEGYTPAESDNAEIKQIDLYQAAYNERESQNKFSNIKIKENKDKGEVIRSIKIKSANPYIWINPVTEDAAAKVKIDGASRNMGGFLKRFTSDENELIIHITSANGKKTLDIPIQIEWEGSRAELAELKAYENAKMSTAYDPGIRSYYAPKENEQDDLKFTFTPLKDTKVTVLVNRQEYMSVSDTQKQYIKVPSDTKEIQWKVTSDTGDLAVYTVYMDREKEEGISESTKQRAKKMITNMINGGYLKDIQRNTSHTYWDIFGTAALGKQYLKGTLAYDVTKHEYTKSTDYAAVILELIMAGENPYNYLGENYVDKLLAYDDGTGYFGEYSANVWALTALQAAGAPIPTKTVTIVQKQALNESFDLDMRGWALYAVSLVKNQISKDDYARCIQSFKEVQIQEATLMNGIDVTGCFENFFYTNRNIMSHACVISGLTSMGIDAGGKEFAGENGSDAVSVLENYQRKSGGWIYSPENITPGGWNKDVTIAVGDLYNGSNVYTRYYLTPSRYKKLVDQAKKLLSGKIEDEANRKALQKAYDEAEQYVKEDSVTSSHGEAYYNLQEAMYAVDQSVKPGVFLGTAEEREKVNAVIKAIDSISSYSYKDKTKLDSIKKQYDALKEERLFHYITNADVLDSAYQYVKDIDTFLEKTNKIGKVNLTKTAKVEAARKAYGSLSEKQKKESAVQKALKTLSEAENKLKDAKTADNVVQAIKSLGEIVTLDSQEDIESVRAAYDGLSDSQKTFVTNIDKLQKQEETLKKLQKQEKDKEEAQKVSDVIDQIGRITTNSENDLKEARSAYDALASDEQKRLVSNYAQLEDGEKIYANIQRENVIYDAVDKASYEIGQIDTAYGENADITEENADEVSAAIQKAESYIKEKEKEYTYFTLMISNYMDLEAAKTALVQYELSDKTETSVEEFKQVIEELKQADSIEQQPVIEKAKTLYNLLSEEEQQSVSEEYALLQEAETSLNIWQMEFDNVQEVVYGIEKLGEVTITDVDTYQEVKDAYDMLSEDAGKLIPDEIKDRLNEVTDIYQKLLNQQEKTDVVIQKIDDASVISDLSDEAAVKKARAAYNALDNPYRVTNYGTLLDEEKEITALKKVQENKKFANAVTTQINALKKVTLSDKEKVEAARRAYDGLTDAQKNLVNNLPILETAESQIESLQKQTSTPSKETKKPVKKVSVKKIILKKKSLKKTIYLNKKKQTYSLALFIKNKEVKTEKIRWVSGNRAVAVISKKGKLTIKKPGKVTITASYKGKKYKYNFTIKKPQLKLKKKSIVIKKGKAAKIKSVVSPKGKIQYKSLNTKIVFVTKKGKVIGKKKGKTKIRVRCNGITRYCKVTVK